MNHANTAVSVEEARVIGESKETVERLQAAGKREDEDVDAEYESKCRILRDEYAIVLKNVETTLAGMAEVTTPDVAPSSTFSSSPFSSSSASIMAAVAAAEAPARMETATGMGLGVGMGPLGMSHPNADHDDFVPRALSKTHTMPLPGPKIVSPRPASAANMSLGPPGANRKSSGPALPPIKRSGTPGFEAGFAAEMSALERAKLRNAAGFGAAGGGGGLPYV